MSGKSSLREDQEMSQAVVEARCWSRWLVQRESRGPGDLENAMRRIETRYGVPFSTLWSLRYRPPKDMLVSAYLNLRAAYIAECERQERAMRHEREIIEAKSAASKALVRAAIAMAGGED